MAYHVTWRLPSRSIGVYSPQRWLFSASAEWSPRRLSSLYCMKRHELPSFTDLVVHMICQVCCLPCGRLRLLLSSMIETILVHYSQRARSDDDEKVKSPGKLWNRIVIVLSDRRWWSLSLALPWCLLVAERWQYGHCSMDRKMSVEKFSPIDEKAILHLNVNPDSLPHVNNLVCRTPLLRNSLDDV